MKPVNISSLIAKYQELKKYTYDSGDYTRVHDFLEAAPAYKKLSAELAEVQKRCTARTISPWDIIAEVDDLKNTLNVSIKALEGIRAEIDTHAQKFPNAYKYTPESTHYFIEVIKGSFYVTEIKRSRTRTNVYEVYHTQNSAAAIVARFTRF